MAKKRGKSRTKVTSKKPKAAGKSADRGIETAKPIKDALHDLEILAEEKKVENKVESLRKNEEILNNKATDILKEEKKIEKESEEVEKLEKEIKKEVSAKPLKELSIKDLNKGIIGAFIGVVAHFAFVYGKEIATQISTTRATVLIVFSYVLIILLMYETGYREIKDKRLLGILPKRATVIYLTSIIMIPIIFFLFNQLNFSDYIGLYKDIAVTSVLASVGAGTADLIGRN